MIRYCLCDAHGERAVQFVKNLKFMTAAQELGVPLFDCTMKLIKESWLCIQENEELTPDEAREYSGLKSENAYIAKKYTAYCRVLEYYWHLRNNPGDTSSAPPLPSPTKPSPARPSPKRHRAA